MNVKKFLWDYEVKDDSLKVLSKYPEFVARVLSFGDAADAEELFKAMNRNDVIAFLRAFGYKLDKRSFNYWRLYFCLPQEFSQNTRPFEQGCCWKPF